MLEGSALHSQIPRLPRVYEDTVVGAWNLEAASAAPPQSDSQPECQIVFANMLLKPQSMLPEPIASKLSIPRNSDLPNVPDKSANCTSNLRLTLSSDDSRHSLLALIRLLREPFGSPNQQRDSRNIRQRLFQLILHQTPGCGSVRHRLVVDLDGGLTRINQWQKSFHKSSSVPRAVKEHH